MTPDSTALAHLGLIFAGVTAAVAIFACFMVQQHVTGRLVLEPGPAVAIMAR